MSVHVLPRTQSAVIVWPPQATATSPRGVCPARVAGEQPQPLLGSPLPVPRTWGSPLPVCSNGANPMLHGLVTQTPGLHKCTSPANGAVLPTPDFCEMIMRELQDKADGQQMLCTAVVELAALVDKVLGEVRSELPKLRQECAEQKYKVTMISEMQADCVKRTEGLDQNLAAEAEARYDAECAQSESLVCLFNRMTSDLSRVQNEIYRIEEDFQRLHENNGKVNNLGGKHVGAVDSSEEDGAWNDCPAIREEGDESMDVEKLDGTIRAELHGVQVELAAQMTDLETKLTTEWMELHGLVDAAANRMNSLESSIQSDMAEHSVRINSLESSIQSNMAENSVRMQEISDQVVQSLEHIRTLKETVDKLASPVCIGTGCTLGKRFFTGDSKDGEIYTCTPTMSPSITPITPRLKSIFRQRRHSQTPQPVASIHNSTPNMQRFSSLNIIVHGSQ